MNCSDFLQNLSLYIDDALDVSQREACDEHLRACPLCRTELAEMQALQRSLYSIRHIAVPVDLADNLRHSVAVELAAQKATRTPIFSPSKIQSWLEFRLLPYTVGTFASVLLFSMLFAALLASINAFREMQTEVASADRETRVLIAPNRYDTNLSISASDYAALRASYAPESPSIDPRSNFVSFTSSLVRGEMNDDAVVVVADVFSNGIAQVADVLEAPNNKDKLAELERILSTDPAFVPATYDKRPENLRVVLMIQKVDVKEEEPDKKELRKNSKKF